MNIVQKVEPFFDEVWCSLLDESQVRTHFKSTPVKTKIYVRRGETLLIKREGYVHMPGFFDNEVNVVVGRVFLDAEEKV